MNLESAIEVLCYIALLIGFYLFLRRSNLAAESMDKFNPKEQLTRKDVFKMGKLTVVDIKWSKMNQYREKELIIPLIPAKHRIICPVFWMNVLFQHFPVSSDLDPLFSYMNHGKVIPLTVEVLAKKYKDWVKKTGRSPKAYILHGLCRGGANHALTVGLGGEDIMLMGDWASNAYLQYIDLTLERRVTNMVKFVDEMDNMLDSVINWDKLEDLDL